MFPIVVLSVAHVSASSIPDDPLLSIPPHPPRLVRSPAYRPDICRELCVDFRADRRGNGYDLCNSPIQSTCISNHPVYPPYCDFLYWSVTDEGFPGLVYSVNGTDLTDEERERPLTCDEADEIIYGAMFMRFANTSSPPSWSTTTDERMEDSE